MWLAEVKAKAKHKNQILFSKDSLLLADLCQLIAQANRRALILWALELAEETARELAGKYPETPYPSVDVLRQLDRAFIRDNLSPGGSADLLAMCWMLRFLKEAGA